MKNLDFHDKVLLSIYLNVVNVVAIEEDGAFKYSVYIEDFDHLNYTFCESSAIFDSDKEAIEYGNEVIKNYKNFYSEIEDLEKVQEAWASIMPLLESLPQNFGHWDNSYLVERLKYIMQYWSEKFNLPDFETFFQQQMKKV